MKIAILLILTGILMWILFDFILKLAEFMLIPFKDGICESCRNCKHTGKCYCLTTWFEEDCIKQKIRCNIVDINQNC